VGIEFACTVKPVTMSRLVELGLDLFSRLYRM